MIDTKQYIEKQKEIKSLMKGKKYPYKSKFISKPVVEAQIIVAKNLNPLFFKSNKYHLNKYFSSLEEIEEPEIISPSEGFIRSLKL